MAFADWDITGFNAQIDNTLLANPLPQPWAGQYCRQVGTPGADASIMISAGYQSGAFVGTSYNKVIRMRGSIRRDINTGGFSGGLTARRTTGYGYTVAYDAGPQTINLLLNNNTQCSFPVTGSVFGPDWFSMEMIIYPIGEAGDRIVISQELVPGSGTYTQLSINGGVPAEGIYISSLNVGFAPYNAVSKCGITSPNAFGYNQGNILVDKVNIALSDVPNVNI